MSKKLLNALTKFRNERTPEEIKKPRMHYNYQNLQHLFDMYNREVSSLMRGDSNYARCRLVWRQVVCFEMRNLPAIDRRIFARSLFYLIEENAEVPQTFEFKSGNKGTFFPTRRDADYGSHSGVGFDYGVDIHTGAVTRGSALASGAELLRKLMLSKNTRLTEPMQPRPRQTSWCMIL